MKTTPRIPQGHACGSRHPVFTLPVCEPMLILDSPRETRGGNDKGVGNDNDCALCGTHVSLCGAKEDVP